MSKKRTMERPRDR